MFKIKIKLLRSLLQKFKIPHLTKKIKRLLSFKNKAKLVGCSLNIKKWMPITCRWEMIILEKEIRFYPYSPDKKIVDEFNKIKAKVESEFGEFKEVPELHYVDYKYTQDLLRGGDSVALYRKSQRKKKAISYVVLHPHLGLARYKNKRRAHVLHELIELFLMQRKNTTNKDFKHSQHTTVKKYERIIGKKHNLPVLNYFSTEMKKLSDAQKQQIIELRKQKNPTTFEEQDKYYQKFYKIIGFKEIKYIKNN